MPDFLLPEVRPGVRGEGKGVRGRFQFRAAAAQPQKQLVFSVPPRCRVIAEQPGYHQCHHLKVRFLPTACVDFTFAPSLSPLSFRTFIKPRESWFPSLGQSAPYWTWSVTVSWMLAEDRTLMKLQNSILEGTNLSEL